MKKQWLIWCLFGLLLTACGGESPANEGVAKQLPLLSDNQVYRIQNLWFDRGGSLIVTEDGQAALDLRHHAEGVTEVANYSLVDNDVSQAQFEGESHRCLNEPLPENCTSVGQNFRVDRDAEGVLTLLLADADDVEGVEYEMYPANNIVVPDSYLFFEYGGWLWRTLRSDALHGIFPGAEVVFNSRGGFAGSDTQGCVISGQLSLSAERLISYVTVEITDCSNAKSLSGLGFVDVWEKEAYLNLMLSGESAQHSVEMF